MKEKTVYQKLRELSRGVIENYHGDMKIDNDYMVQGDDDVYYVLHRECGSEACSLSDLLVLERPARSRILYDWSNRRRWYRVKITKRTPRAVYGDIARVTEDHVRRLADKARPDEDHSIPMKITLSRYENTNGEIMFIVLAQGNIQCIAPTGDEQFAADYARTLYHNHHGRAQYTYWDGVKGVETILESKAT